LAAKIWISKRLTRTVRLPMGGTEKDLMTLQYHDVIS